MTQYYELLAFDDDNQAVQVAHYPLGAGAKLMEQACADSPYIAAIGLLHTAGVLDGRRLVVRGDYASADDILQAGITSYAAGWGYEDVEDLSSQGASLLKEASGISFDTSTFGRAKIITPEDLVDREAEWFARPGDDALVATLPSGEREFLSPPDFNSPTDKTVMSLAGGVWAAAYILLATRSGPSLDIMGRWTGARLTMEPWGELHADAGATDITSLCLSGLDVEKQYVIGSR